MKRAKRFALIFSIAGFSLTANVLPPLVTHFSQTLQLASEKFGLVFMLQNLGFTLCSLGIGFLYQRKKLPLIALLIATLFSAALGVAFLPLAGTFTILILLMVLVGSSGGTIESIAMALLSEGDNSGPSIYASQFFFTVGAIISPLLVGLLLQFKFTMPQIMQLIALVALLIALAVTSMLFIGREPKKQIQTSHVIHKEVQEQQGFALLFLAMLFYVALESSLTSWLPTYFEQVKGYPTSSASLIVTLFWLALAAMRLTYVYIKQKKISKALSLHSYILVGALALLLLPFGTIPLIIIIGLASGPLWPLVIEYSNEKYQSSHLVMYLVGAGSIGAIIGPQTTSLLFARVGLERLPLILLCYGLLFAVSVVSSLKFKIKR